MHRFPFVVHLHFFQMVPVEDLGHWRSLARFLMPLPQKMFEHLSHVVRFKTILLQFFL